MPGKVRIIGGSWRGRKLDVSDISELRPSPDRVRETLFNWLQPYIIGAHCLDLYAGTGILGFESLSRGANRVVMVEHNVVLTKNLQLQAKKLNAKEIDIVCMDVITWLKNCTSEFDIIYLDPPYSDKQAGNILAQLLNCGCLKQGSIIYVETDYEMEDVDSQLQIIKSAKAGVVQYQLFRSENREN